MAREIYGEAAGKNRQPEFSNIFATTSLDAEEKSGIDT